MRLALIVPVPPVPDGRLLDIHAANIAQARALARADFDVRLYIRSQRSFRREVGDGAQLCGITERPRVPIVGAALVRAALDDGCQALHCFHMLDVRTLSFAVRKARRVPVYAEYNTGRVPRSRLRAEVLRRVSRRLAGVFFTAAEMASPFWEQGALHPSTPVFAVPEVSSLLPDPETVRRPTDPPRILVVARAAPFKRPEVILRAYARIIEERPEAQ